MGTMKRVTSGSSPHTRGAPYATKAPLRDHPRIRGEHHDIPLLGVLARGIIPAYAGSTTDVVCASVEYEGSSPHTRGARWTARGRRPPPGDHPRIRGEHDWPCLVRDQELGIIPAYAGSTPHHTIHCESSEGSSPHTRGIIPAYAGSTPQNAMCQQFCQGSSPHTRGARTTTWSWGTTRRDHPRIRGEHHSWRAPSLPLPGIARWDHPRIRGEHLRAGSLLHIIQGIIPAYAGSTR